MVIFFTDVKKKNVANIKLNSTHSLNFYYYKPKNLEMRINSQLNRF